MQSATTPESDDSQHVPRHVAVIMDGNGRWARARGLPTLAGHRAGAEVIRKLLRACREHGVDVLTLFAFSSENWQRPREEVRGLMALFARYLRREVRELDESGVRVRIIGDRERFGQHIGRLMADAERQTADNTTSTLVIAADYGGQWDIAQAAAALAREAVAGRLDPDRIGLAEVQARLCLSDLPPPDLLIRTGGDYRISNFLLWQIAYTELHFTECYWPDFDVSEFRRALDEYAARERRFGARPQAARVAAC